MTFDPVRLLAACASFALFIIFPAYDSIAVEGAPSARTPVSFYTQNATDRRAGGAADQLLQRARDRGQVRVIVGLRTTMRMEHTLSPQDVTRQRASLRRIEDSVIGRVLQSTPATSVERFEFIPYISLFVTASELARLIDDPDVVSIQEDVPKPLALSDSTKIIHAPELWAKGVDGTDQTIAVLDTGAQTDHPMLDGKVVSEACYSTSNAAAMISPTCPGGATSSTADGSGTNCPLAVKGCDHGTHVASIAAGNSSKLDGVARGANLIIIKVFSRVDDPAACKTVPCPLAYDTDVIKGLKRVYTLRNKYKIAALNISIGGGLYDAACDGSNAAYATAMNNVRNAGIAPTVAAGNDGNLGKISSPACLSSSIAIGNTQKDDLLAESSNHNALVKLLAPGSKIQAAVPNNKYGVKTGTSMAAPHVAGAFALLRDAKPDATVDDMLAALSCTGKSVTDQYSSAFDLLSLSPVRPRIDMLGAYNHLLKPTGAARTWNFSDPMQALDWTPLRGDWAVSGGSYAQTPAASNDWGMSSVDNCDNSLQVEATMTRVDPSPFDPMTHNHYNAGILLKTTVDYPNKERAGYFFAYNVCRTNTTTNQCTDLPSDKIGNARAFRLESTQSGTLLCQKYVPVKKDLPNTLKVISKGSLHTFYVNGKEACKFTDATYTVGPVMLASYMPNVAGHSFSVDSVTITSLDKAPKAKETDVMAVMDPQAMASRTSRRINPAGTGALVSPIARVQ